jgi:PRTRC genetic system ThiF family protein
MTEHVLSENFLRQRVKVVVVGAGGNGSHVVNGLAQLHVALLALGHPGGFRVEVVDGDVVSEANVGRQLFSMSDVGRPKADVLVHRLNCFYGLDWESVYGRFEECSGGNRCDILIGCVDSKMSRRIIHGRLKECAPAYWLDLGNDRSMGQVVLGEPRRRGQRKNEARLPTVVELFPEILDDRQPEPNGPSCSLAEALESQELFINRSVSTFALQVLWTLFRKGRIRHHGYFVNLETGRVVPLEVGRAELCRP